MCQSTSAVSTFQFKVCFHIMLMVGLKGCEVIMIVHSVFHKAILKTYKVSIKTFNWIKKPLLAIVLRVGSYLLLMQPSVNLESAGVWQAACTDMSLALLFCPQQFVSQETVCFLADVPIKKDQACATNFVGQLFSLQV